MDITFKEIKVVNKDGLFRIDIDFDGMQIKTARKTIEEICAFIIKEHIQYQPTTDQVTSNGRFSCD